MLTNGKVNDTVWAMKDNMPTEAYIAEVHTTESISGTSTIYGVVFNKSLLGKTAGLTMYPSDKLYDTKDSMKTALFGAE